MTTGRARRARPRRDRDAAPRRARPPSPTLDRRAGRCPATSSRAARGSSGTAVSTFFRSRSSFLPRPLACSAAPMIYASRRRSSFASARRNMRSRSASRRSGSPESVGPLLARTASPSTPVLEEEAIERRLVLQVDVLLAAARAIERRLRDVEVAVLEELGHLPVEEREEQRPDVAAVDVGVGHQDDLVVAELLDVEAAARRSRSRAPR